MAFKDLVKVEDPKVKKDLWRILWRSNLIQGSTNVVVQQAHGVIYTFAPLFEEIYKDDEEERHAAYQRHSVYYLSNPYTSAIVWSLVYILEKKRAADKNSVSSESIENMKVALMGPLAAIGDTLFQGSLGTIISAICMGMAMDGSPFGAVLQFFLWGALLWVAKYLFTFVTYNKGESFITELLTTNAFAKLTEVIQIVGLMMMGVLTSTTITFNLNWIVKTGEVETNIQQGLFDKLLPGLLPLVILFTTFHLIKDKRISPDKIIYGMMVLGIIMSYLGLV